MSDLVILQEHTEKLLTASETLQTWLTSSYGDYMQFTNEATLRELRQYWIQYKTIDVSGNINKIVRIGMLKRSKEIGTSSYLHGLRSAGPLWFSGMEVSGHSYRKYWETGVAGGNSMDSKALGEKGKGYANPMFAVSSAPSGVFAVHYGSEPLLGFNLAETFRVLECGKKLPLAAQSDRLSRGRKNPVHQLDCKLRKVRQESTSMYSAISWGRYYSLPTVATGNYFQRASRSREVLH